MGKGKQKVITLIVTLFMGLLMLGFIKGENNKSGMLSYQSAEIADKKVGSPFESSGSTSRYALTQAIADSGTIYLNNNRAEFASPDVSGSGGKYFSLFNPGVSFMGVPFYWLGKQNNIPQLITYLSTTVFALINAFLVARIARRLGVSFYASLLSGVLFIFGTNALSYSFTFTQHHASTLVILLATLSSIGHRSLLGNIWFGFLYGTGLLIDMPNGIIMLPLVFYVFIRHFDLNNKGERIKLSIKLSFIGVILGLIPMLGILGWYNNKLTGSYITLPQLIGRSEDFWDTETVVDKDGKNEETTSHLPFKTRNQINGLYVFFFSSERGIPVYAPVAFIGAFGLFLVHKKRKEVVVILSVVLTNIIIYMLFSDATGSWAFGPRYLIPGIALISSGIGIVIQRFRTSRVFMIMFFLVSAYSICVNVLGATTTTMVPPKTEAVNLENPIPYTYKYNWQLITEEELNGSLFYNLYFSDQMYPIEYTLYLTFFVLALVVILYSTLFYGRRNN